MLFHIKQFTPNLVLNLYFAETGFFPEELIKFHSLPKKDVIMSYKNYHCQTIFKAKFVLFLAL